MDIGGGGSSKPRRAKQRSRWPPRRACVPPPIRGWLAHAAEIVAPVTLSPAQQHSTAQRGAGRGWRLAPQRVPRVGVQKDRTGRPKEGPLQIRWANTRCIAAGGLAGCRACLLRPSSPPAAPRHDRARGCRHDKSVPAKKGLTPTIHLHGRYADHGWPTVGTPLSHALVDGASALAAPRAPTPSVGEGSCPPQPSTTATEDFLRSRLKKERITS